MPAEWLMTKVSIDSTSCPACSSSGTRSAIDLFLGLRLSRTPTSPNWKEASTRTTRLPRSVAAATDMLTATVVRPTPPFGLNTATTVPGSPAPPSEPAARAVGRCRRGRRHGDKALLLALAAVHLSDGGRELIRAERLDQELAGPGQHGSAEVVRLTLDGHHHDRGGRDGPGQLFRGGDAIHVRHVDVHQDDIRGEGCRHADGLSAGRRGADHVHVALEAKQLREVVARLRDVVDDQDSDVGNHRVGQDSLCAVPGGLLSGMGMELPGPAAWPARSLQLVTGSFRFLVREDGLDELRGEDPVGVDEFPQDDAAGVHRDRATRDGLTGRRIQEVIRQSAGSG